MIFLKITSVVVTVFVREVVGSVWNFVDLEDLVKINTTLFINLMFLSFFITIIFMVNFSPAEIGKHFYYLE